MPGIVTGMIMAFTLSIDDFVISYFTSGTTQTLPIYIYSMTRKRISPEINVLGMTVDEAVAQLDKYLDDAYIAHLPQVRIVHGKGTGALRAGIHKHLKRLKYIKEFHLGGFGEGDAGVTIVVFK